MTRPVVLAILDGWGFSKKEIGNPIAKARKPTIDLIGRQYPMTLLQASGLAVGMIWGESGNSEVGHLSIGAGRIIEQYLSRINRSIANGTFRTNSAITGAFDHAQKNSSRLHILGLLTSGTAHANFSHIIALLEIAVEKRFGETYLHLFLDGKDSGLQEAPSLLDKLQSFIQSRGYGKLATLIGRNFAMDRDNNWELTRQAYELLSQASGKKTDNYISDIKEHYANGGNDSDTPAILVGESNFDGIKDGDALIFFNFREDSMRQILEPFVKQGFSLFPRIEYKNTYICTITKYSDNSQACVAYDPPIINNSLTEVLENNSKKQLHIAETEKYAHVTYFFNGLKNKEVGGEIDIFIESNKNHEQEPAMKSREIAQKVVEEINKDIHDFVILNFANADMLAHTGNFDATVKGIESIDAALKIIYDAVLEKDGILLITADHGNAESLVYRGSGEVETRHDDNPVPFYLVLKQYQKQSLGEINIEISGILGDIAPTILELMNISQPEEMTGKSLLSVLLK